MKNPDTDETNEDDIEDSFGAEEGAMEEEEYDGLLEAIPSSAASRRPGDSARRRVEEYLEMKRAARELADLDSFEFD